MCAGDKRWQAAQLRAVDYGDFQFWNRMLGKQWQAARLQALEVLRASERTGSFLI